MAVLVWPSLENSNWPLTTDNQSRKHRSCYSPRRLLGKRGSELSAVGNREFAVGAGKVGFHSFGGDE